jgi:hypothetical protein
MTRPTVKCTPNKHPKQWAALVKLDKDEHSAEDAEWAHYLTRERATHATKKNVTPEVVALFQEMFNAHIERDDDEPPRKK